MLTFVCRYALVYAEHFDGTRESTLAMAEAFPRRVMLDVARDGVLVLQSDGLVELPRNFWIAERRAITACSDEDFHVMRDRRPWRLP